MRDSPFVGREDELRTLTDAISDDDPASMIPVVGATGIGKSTLLATLANQCRDRDYRVLYYELNEPPSVEHFLSRLLDHWQDLHPSIVSDGSKTLRQDIMSNLGHSLSQSSGTGSSILGGILNTISGESDENEVTDITSKLLELAVETREKSSENQFILIIDQFDRSRIDEEVHKDIATILREFSSDAPNGVVCCVGTRERFYELSDSNVRELELQPLEVEDVRDYLDDLGLDTEAAKRVHEAASGSPYFVERIGQIVSEKGDIGSVLSDLSEVKTERRRILEERFLDTLDEFSQRLLRETCFLPELKPQLVAHVLDEDITDIESSLRKLERRSILTQLGYSKGSPVYRLHGLNRDFLRERLSDVEKAGQHARAAGYFALQMKNTQTARMRELLTEEGVQRQREYLTAGVMFEYHLQQFPNHFDAEERIKSIFESISDDESSARKAVQGYFKGYREYSIGAERLGATPTVDVGSIATALNNYQENNPEENRDIGSVIRGLKAEDTLNDDQTEVILTIIRFASNLNEATSGDYDPEEIVDQIDKQRELLTTEEFPDAHELCKLGRVSIDLLKTAMVKEIDLEDVWPKFKQEYGITWEDYQILSEVVINTASCLFDLSVMSKFMEDEDGGSATVVSKLQDSVSVERDGVEMSIQQNLESPLFIVYQALQAPSKEELEELSVCWSELEARFEDREIEFLAAFCRDVQNMVLSAIPGNAAKPMVGLKLMNSIDVDSLESLGYEPVETIIQVMKALRGVSAHDPKLAEE